MATVQAAKIPRSETEKRELYATVCYYYPQYKLQEAAGLPARDVILLINTAQRIEAMKFYNFTQIAAAPHSKKGVAVRKLADHFKRMARV